MLTRRQFTVVFSVAATILLSAIYLVRLVAQGFQKADLFLILVLGFDTLLLLVLSMMVSSGLGGRIAKRFRESWQQIILYLTLVVLVYLQVSLFERFVPTMTFIDSPLAGIYVSISVTYFLLLALSLCLFIIVDSAVLLYRAIRRSDLSKLWYYGYVSIVIFAVVVLLQGSTCDQDFYARFYNDMLTLSSVERTTDPAAVVIDLSGERRMPKAEAFVRTLKILERYKPEAIVMTFGLNAFDEFQKDSSLFVRLYQQQGLTSTVILHETGSGAVVSKCPDSIVAGTNIYWGSGTIAWSNSELPMYFTPAAHDLAVNVLHPSRRIHGVEPPGPSFTEQQPETGIPVNNNGKALIPYHTIIRYEIPNQSYYAFSLNYQEGSDTVLAVIPGSGLRFNGIKGIVEEPALITSPRGVTAPGYRFATFPELRRTVLVITDNLREGMTYAAIIDGLKNPSYKEELPQPLLLTGIVVLLLLMAIVFRNVAHWKALTIVLVLFFLTGVLIVGSFFIGSTLVNPYPFMMLFLLSVLFFFPAEVPREQEQPAEQEAQPPIQIVSEKEIALRAERQLARTVQLAMLPIRDPAIKGFECSATSIPADHVGGDFYDLFWLDEKNSKMAIALGDSSARGMEGSMSAVMAGAALSGAAAESDSPRKILGSMNNTLVRRSRNDIFTALSMAVLRPKTNVLTYSTAGQVPAMVVHRKKVITLTTVGTRLPLGLKEDLEYQELKIRLVKGDVVLFTSNGIPGAINQKGESYGFERLEQHLLQWHNLPASEIRDRILEDVKTFMQYTEQVDDYTLVVLKAV